MKKSKQVAEDGITARLAGHEKLERRRLLNVDFGFDAMTGELTLSDFEDSDAMVGNEVRFEEIAPDTYEITLSEGNWDGVDVAGVTGNGSNVLTLDNTAGIISSILSRGTTADAFDVEFGNFDFGGDLTFEQDGASSNFGSLTQDAASSITHGGTPVSYTHLTLPTIYSV